MVGSTHRRSKGVATGNANELHECRQIEQHTTIVTSSHPLACPRTHNHQFQRRYDKPHRMLLMHKYGRLCGYRPCAAQRIRDEISIDTHSFMILESIFQLTHLIREFFRLIDQKLYYKKNLLEGIIREMILKNFD